MVHSKFKGIGLRKPQQADFVEMAKKAFEAAERNKTMRESSPPQKNSGRFRQRKTFTVNINGKYPHYVEVEADNEYDALVIAEKEWELGIDKEYMKEYEDGRPADFYME